MLDPGYDCAHTEEFAGEDRYWLDERAYLACCGRLLTLLADLLAYAGDPCTDTDSARGLISAADRIMQRRFRHGCTVAEVAQALGYSRQHSTFCITLADAGWKKALSDDEGFMAGLNVHAGHVCCEAVAKAHDLNYTEPTQFLL